MAVERVNASSFIDTSTLSGSGGLGKGSRKADLSFGSILSRAQYQNLANSYSSANNNNNSDRIVEGQKFEVNVNKTDGKEFGQDSANAGSEKLVKSTTRSSVDTTKAENKIEGAIAKAVEEVREVIKDELDITDEELTAAMEVLGLTMTDLLKPESITAIIAEVTGAETADILLNEDLAASVMDIMRVQRNVTSDLIEELDISPEEFKAMLDGKAINIVLPDTEVSGEDAPRFELKLDASKDGLQAVINTDDTPDTIKSEAKEVITTDTDKAPVVEAKEEGSKEETVKVIANEDPRTKEGNDQVKGNVEVISDEDKETIRTNTEVVNSSSGAAESDRQPKSDTEVIDNTQDNENAENAVEVKPEAQDKKDNAKGDGKESSGEEKDMPAPKTATRASANIRHFDGTKSAKPDVSTSFQQNMTDAIKEAVGNTVEANVTEQLNNAARAEDIMRQITEQVKVQIKADTASMELELNPASLGKVGLHIESKGGVVTAHILAQNETVKSAIESQVVTLKESIEAKGIKVQEVEVTVASHAFEHNLMGDQSSGNRFGTDDRGGSERSSRLRRINLGSDGTYNGQAEAIDEGEELARRIMIDNGGSLDLMA